MMIRHKHALAVALVAALLVAGAFWSWRFLRSSWPALGPAAPIPSTMVGQPAPLDAADGWTPYLLTNKVPGARDVALDTEGNLWVSQPSEGRVALIYLAGRDTPEVTWPLRGLDKPHGLAFDPKNPSHLYVATETSVIRVLTYSDAPVQRVAALPRGGRHTTRTLAFGEDGRLYVSIGSTCDVCHEQNPEHGSIISMKTDGSDRQITARGLRNAVFIAMNPQTREIWSTEMGRDHLGDNLPPDEVNIIRGGGNYGWPICYGQNIHDTQFDKNTYIRNPCMEPFETASEIDLPAHVAPLGLAFLGKDDLLVGYHGSWNSSVPVGYKVARWQKRGGSWTSADFLSGFLKNGAAIGRPVDVLVMPDGSVLVSDDKSGSIWQVIPDR